MDGETEEVSLRIQLLGAFRVWVGPRAIPDSAWRRRKAANVVKLLALSSRHRMHREEVLETLWPELPPRAADNNLHRTLHLVRHTLDPNLSPGCRSHYLSLHGDVPHQPDGM